VNVLQSAPASVTNVANVSGGGDINISNNSASDPTTITAAQVIDLSIAKTHSGNFTQGQSGASYSIVVTNSGSAASNGLVTVADSLPTGLTATSMGGAGWSCSLGALSCTRSDALEPSVSYPAITLTVDVASNAPPSLTNTASVNGG